MLLPGSNLFNYWCTNLICQFCKPLKILQTTEMVGHEPTISEPQIYTKNI